MVGGREVEEGRGNSEDGRLCFGLFQNLYSQVVHFLGLLSRDKMRIKRQKKMTSYLISVKPHYLFKF